jgi:hypothetical protein
LGFVVALVMFGPSQVNAAYITTVTIREESIIGSAESTGVRFSFGPGGKIAKPGEKQPAETSTEKEPGEKQPAEKSKTTIELVLTLSDINQSFEFAADDYAPLVAHLTNGEDDGLVLRVVPNNGKTAKPISNLTESIFFSTALPPVANGPDLAGYTLDRITLKVTTLSVTEKEDEDGNPYTDIQFEGTLDFEGQLNASPAPPSLLLALVGAPLLVVRFRRRHPALEASGADSLAA